MPVFTNRFMRKDRAAYETMYALIRPVVKDKTVLELATGTGLIAKHIVNAAAHIEATDASAEMIAEAERDNRSAKLHFSVQDMFFPALCGRILRCGDRVKRPAHCAAAGESPAGNQARTEGRRCADCADLHPCGKFVFRQGESVFHEARGIPLHSRWTSEEYLTFLRQNGWTVRKSVVLKASFPLTYAECVKSEV